METQKQNFFQKNLPLVIVAVVAMLFLVLWLLPQTFQNNLKTSLVGTGSLVSSTPPVSDSLALPTPVCDGTGINTAPCDDAILAGFIAANSGYGLVGSDVTVVHNAAGRITNITAFSKGSKIRTFANILSLTSLTQLYLSGNQLTGTIPSLPASLTQLYLYSNQLTGSIPSLSASSSLTILYLSDNQLTGTIPSLPASLTDLSLQNNQLTGSIPSLSASSSLTQLNLGINQLTGSIPSLPASLTGLWLRSNQLTGSIPSLPASLTQLDLVGNRLSGGYSNIGSISGLTTPECDVFSNYLNQTGGPSNCTWQPQSSNSNVNGSTNGNTNAASYSLSLTASPTNPTVGTMVALTPVCSQQPVSPYKYLLYEDNNFTTPAYGYNNCQGFGFTHTTSGTHTYIARIARADGTDVQAVSNTVQVTWTSQSPGGNSNVNGSTNGNTNSLPTQLTLVASPGTSVPVGATVALTSTINTPLPNGYHIEKFEGLQALGGCRPNPLSCSVWAISSVPLTASYTTAIVSDTSSPPPVPLLSSNSVTTTWTNSGNSNANGSTNTNNSQGVSITLLNPNQGPIGTVVTVTGTGFSPTGNGVSFGTGFIPNVPSTNGGTTLVFTAPDSLSPACSFSTPPCLILTQQTTPGVYQVSVGNSGGQHSNSLSFTVTGNGSTNTNSSSCFASLQTPTSGGQNSVNLHSSFGGAVPGRCQSNAYLVIVEASDARCLTDVTTQGQDAYCQVSTMPRYKITIPSGSLNNPSDILTQVPYNLVTTSLAGRHEGITLGTPIQLNPNKTYYWKVTILDPTISLSICTDGTNYYTTILDHSSLPLPTPAGCYNTQGVFTTPTANTNTNSSQGVGITLLSPNQGPVGTVVTVTGTGFSPTGNGVSFGTGFIPNVPSTNGGTTLVFTVPTGLNPPCSFVQPPCNVLTQQTIPGIYQVSVGNSGGQHSNNLPFTVTGNGNTNSSSNTFVPTNVVATSAATSNNVFVRWDAVGTTRVSKYIVYRSPCAVAGTNGQPCSGYNFTKVGETHGSVVFIDAVGGSSVAEAGDVALAAGANSYVYVVSSVVAGVESNQSSVSNAVTVGVNGTGGISSAFVILPYSTDQAVHLTAYGLGTGVLTWASSAPTLVSVTNAGDIQIVPTAPSLGGVSFITATNGSNQYATMLVIVWPRGDTDGNFLINAVDQNDVAVGWNG